MRVNETNYNYSYVITNKKVSGFLESDSKKINEEWSLYHSNDLDVEVYEENQNKLILLGYALDIRNGSLQDLDILERLTKVENIEDGLDFINGRYVLIVRKSDDIKIYTDASALLPINYSADKKIISSHDVIIKDIIEATGEVVSLVEDELKGSFDFTRYKDVFKFNPSLSLSLSSGEFNRYYPQKEMVNKDIDLIIKELEIYFEQMLIWLKNWNNDIVLTLTGGYDSRVSLALTREINDKIEYITYIHPNLKRLSERAQEIYDIDMFITKSLRDNMNLNHTMVNLADYDIQGEERDYYKKVLQSSHSYPLIDYFENKRRFNKVLHIKSTVFGMGKSDFPLIQSHSADTYEEMGDFIHGVSKEAQESANYPEIVKSYFERNLQSENVGRGRHFFEMFHLESRMGNWHSNVTQETDPALLDFIFVNTRRIIDLIQSPSIQERRDKVLYTKLINKYWPALLFVGFNEKDINLDYNKVGLSNIYINGLKIYELNQLELEKTDNTITIKPDSEITGPQNQYVFKAKNNTHQPKVLNIKSLFNKENGRKYINVRIMKLENKTYKTIDIVDLYDGYELTLEPFKELMIRIDYNHGFDKTSWQNAGRVQISNI
ncbi:hypothetical protein [Jeotgalicoccus sp. ATCC 8456]|uniref:hypothetical protein n=1 Tax=Jeotgalicoccus sp. ATCC 8456 TaxID=946435 RepID=UPI0018E650A9|nr:hypothetical protein [Jeotgalicoccus sp. ATCC 8456]QQD85664.1 hypothetical protein JEM45_03300 [Jeotgalicoccus sp. ATCC 8456]